jgi:hypothetical protein
MFLGEVNEGGRALGPPDRSGKYLFGNRERQLSFGFVYCVNRDILVLGRPANKFWTNSKGFEL